MKKLLFSLFLMFFIKISSQCTGCNVTNPTGSNYSFTAGNTYCFTQNTTFSDVNFANNVRLCIAPGVTVIIQNNINYTGSNPNVTFDIGGTLQFGQSPNISANLTINILSGGILRAGSSGGNNFTFNGSGTNTLTNYGTVQVSVLGFGQSSATNIIDNYATYTIGSNINIQGNTIFRNNGTINIGSSYNNNSTSTYINCGTITSANGYNLGGGKVINTGTFNVGSGSIDMSGNSRMENYGVMTSLGVINGSSNAVLYNEGLARFTSVQLNGATIKGPTSSSKKGYVYMASATNPNGLRVGPNLDFTRYTSNSFATKSGSQGQSQIFNSNPLYVNAAGGTVTQAVANVTYDCNTSCTAPMVVSIGLCPNTDGSFPPVANDDSYSLSPGSSSPTSILLNDWEQYNGVAATTSNVIITQVSTTNPNVNINPATGLVTTNPGTAGGTYTIVYRICRINYPTSCDTAIVTVIVLSTHCTKQGATGTPDGYTKVGISTLANRSNNWPEGISIANGGVPNGFIALQSHNKGFVITRVASSASITEPKKGMLIYDIAAACVKLYNGTMWKCIARACNE